LVAVVGRPNVGKSTLFNRLVGRRAAIVEDQPGVTRDRRYGQVEWCGFEFRVVDTGGLDLAAKAGIRAAIARQVHVALGESALVLFVVDAREGLTPSDRDVAEVLRHSGRSVLYVANKVDGPQLESASVELFELGAAQLFPISAAHGRGMAELLDAIVERLRPPVVDTDFDDELGSVGPLVDHGGVDDASSLHSESGDVVEAAGQGEGIVAPIRLAFVGKPNAGKSSLVNRLLGEERVVVDSQPGTTTDPVDTPLERNGQRYVLIDTAGIRRKRSIATDELTERVAVSMAIEALKRTDVAVLVIDASLGISDQDQKIAALISDAGRGAVIAMNKQDLIVGPEARAELEKQLETQLHFVDYAPVIGTSGHTGQGLDKLFAAVNRAYVHFSRRVPTAELNRFLEQTLAHQPPPAPRHGKQTKMYYMVQPAAQPPTFLISTNHPEGVPVSYRRFLVNRLRDTFGFDGTFIRVILRRRGETRRGAAGAAG
jgi:GTP-binding protein